MKKLFIKEIKLILSPMIFVFAAMTLLIFVPTFPPISNMAYCLIGLITVLNVAIVDRDFEFTALLPVPRRHIVAGKCFALVFSELLQILVAIPCVFIMIKFGLVNIFKHNTNLTFFAAVILNYSVFNLIFIPWFFKTAEKVNKPLLTGLMVYFVMSGIYSVLNEMYPILNGVGTEGLALRAILLLVSILIYIAATLFAYKSAVQNFEKVSI